MIWLPVLLLLVSGPHQVGANPAPRLPMASPRADLLPRSFGADAPPQSSSMEKTILDLEQQWQEALLASDVDALDRLYAETLVYTHSNASVDDKATYLENIRAGRSRYLTLERDDIRVQVHGEAAIVTCHWKVQSIGNGTRYQTDARYLHVYVLQEGTWRMIAHQSTLRVP